MIGHWREPGPVGVIDPGETARVTPRQHAGTAAPDNRFQVQRSILGGSVYKVRPSSSAACSSGDSRWPDRRDRRGVGWEIRGTDDVGPSTRPSPSPKPPIELGPPQFGSPEFSSSTARSPQHDRLGLGRPHRDRCRDFVGISGRQGAIASALAFIGVIAGAAGILLAPKLMELVDSRRHVCSSGSRSWWSSSSPVRPPA